VVERTDVGRRGKGYALDFGVRHLAADPPEVLIIVDADCQVGEGSLDLLAKKSALAGRPVQALDLMQAAEGAGLKARVAAFAWLVKNWVRPLGWHRLGWPCQLMGTGMAFPWPLAETMQLANANIVEDMKLGIDLALAGRAPLFCPEALVTSEFPLADAAVKSQRTRWEHGHLSMILQEVPRLLGGALAKGDLRLLAMALDLAVPPLALLAMLLVGLWAVAGAGLATGWLGLGFLPFQLASLGLGLFAAAVLLAWLGWGRQVVSGIDLLSIPVYVLAKIPLYLKFWGKRQKEWVRTERE
jgi:cellulose synthase/poly-beta-1,6-N-acetylglucosamine synthase-like glycosyltransferase